MCSVCASWLVLWDILLGSIDLSDQISRNFLKELMNVAVRVKFDICHIKTPKFNTLFSSYTLLPSLVIFVGLLYCY